jgi:hypothetical protein
MKVKPKLTKREATEKVIEIWLFFFLQKGLLKSMSNITNIEILREDSVCLIIK